MRTRILFAAMFFAQIAFSKTDTLNLKSNISNVTVFFNGAQVTREADFKAVRGQYLLVLDKLPAEISTQSVQVKAPKNCKILSVRNERSVADSKKTKEESAIQASIDRQEFRMKEIKNQLSVYGIEEKLLLDNSVIDKGKGSAVNELKSAADFYRSRINEIRRSELMLNQQLDSASENIKESYAKLNVIASEKNKNYSKVILSVDVQGEMINPLKLSYYIQSAGWTPVYDFRVDDISKPFVIAYNANVYQSSGEDWNDINIKLSSSNPKLSAERPTLQTWFFGRATQSIPKPELNGVGAIRGKVYDNTTHEPVPFASITILKNNVEILATTSDFDGMYMLKPIEPGTYDIKVTYVGYMCFMLRSVYVKPSEITIVQLPIMQTKVELKEVTIQDYKNKLIDPDKMTSSYDYNSQDIQSRAVPASVGSVSVGLSTRGGRDDGTMYVVDAMKVRSADFVVSNNIANTLHAGVTGQEYVIDIPYTIPSDGEDYQIRIKETSIPANYVYYAAPKIDRDAFLTVEIPDWSTLDLLSGKSSIYFEGTFIGTSEVNADEMNDTLRLSLGRDKDIIVKREANNKETDKKSSGSTVKENVSWNISVRNNKSAAVKIIVEDQYPMAETKSIEVGKPDIPGASIDENGKISWELTVPPAEKKLINFKYNIKYPRYASN
jgi:hypothetical protein